MSEPARKKKTTRKGMTQLQTNESREKYINCRKETRTLLRAKVIKYEVQKYVAMKIYCPKPGFR